VRQFIFLLPFSLILLPCVSSGQKQDSPQKNMRVLSIGNHPLVRTEYTNGRLIELPPLPGSLPPRSLTLQSITDQTMSFPNKLGRLSSPLKFNSNLDRITLIEGDSVGGNPWHSFNTPKPSHSLAVFWRNSKWSKPSSKVLKDGVQDFPAEKIRIINFSPATLLFQINKGEIFKLKPGGGTIKDIKIGLTSMKVILPLPGKKDRRICNRDIEVKKGERVNAFFFKSDGEKVRHPVSHFIKSEIAKNYAPPKKEKKRTAKAQ